MTGTLEQLEEPWLSTTREALEGYLDGGFPIAASIVVDDEIVALAHNRSHDHIIDHAEVRVIRAIGSRDVLSRGVIYTTMEPCPMCTGAIRVAKLKKLVYATSDPAAGDAAHLSDTEFMSFFGCEAVLDDTPNLALFFASLLIECRIRLNKTRWHDHWAARHPEATRIAQTLFEGDYFRRWTDHSASGEDIWRDVLSFA